MAERALLNHITPHLEGLVSDHLSEVRFQSNRKCGEVSPFSLGDLGALSVITPPRMMQNSLHEFLERWERFAYVLCHTVFQNDFIKDFRDRTGVKATWRPGAARRVRPCSRG